ncbi:hypothetical protein HMPREF0043_01382 [Actinobaculum sp. oral taxon 183 str. F0552]|nr:hypothetical protein HMPREF0043_01382 [Actinobaculum sp. oral taxon 183 str. F0552]
MLGPGRFPRLRPVCREGHGACLPVLDDPRRCRALRKPGASALPRARRLR